MLTESRGARLVGGTAINELSRRSMGQMGWATHCEGCPAGIAIALAADDNKARVILIVNETSVVGVEGLGGDRESVFL